MIKKDPTIIRAERLRAVMAMPEYEVTVGAWLKEAEAEATHRLQNATEIHEIHRAQGAVNLIKSINEQFQRTFQLEEAARDKALKRTIKKETHV